MKIQDRLINIILNEEEIKITKKNIEHIHNLTDNNDHTEARIYLAGLFKLNFYKDKFIGIKHDQDRRGHLIPELNDKRNLYTKQMLKEIRAMLMGNVLLYDSIKSAL